MQTQALKPRPYHVQTTNGEQKLMATSPSQAISSALELSGPRAKLVRVSPQGDW
jgi:hypothetical protein